MPVRDEAAKLADEIAELRHSIHREPEIGLHLPKTQAKVLAALDGLPLEISTGQALSSVTAVLRGGRHSGAGPVVLLRGDMDALPVTEETGLPYASGGAPARCTPAATTCTRPCWPAPRACWPRSATSCAGTVIFMFQPGEEGYDGARHMIDRGRARRGRAAAGRRLRPARDREQAPVRDVHHPAGPDAGRRRPDHGAPCTARGGHASQPHRAADPIPAACEMVLALQTMVTRKFDVFDPVVITVGSFHAGTAAT